MKCIDYKAFNRLLKIALTCGVLGGLIGGILSGKKSAVAESPLEKYIGIGVFFIILIFLALYWILPNTTWGRKKLQLSEQLYILTYVIGIISGLFGLIATFLNSQFVIYSHLFELLLVLFSINYIFWGMILKSKQTTSIEKILDEKQRLNIAQSGAMTFILSTAIMILMYFASYQRAFVLDGQVWFLYYIFISMIIFSIANIYYFRKE
jgi:hypothetical protein